MTNDNKETSFEVWRLVTSIYRIWYRNAEKELAKEDVSVMEYRILRQLVESGPQPMVKLADQNLITQGWVTSLVDRLESRKYVERVRSSTDRRVVNIGPTDAGIKFYKNVVELHEDFVAKTLDFMDETNRAHLKALLNEVEEHLIDKKSSNEGQYSTFTSHD